MRHLLLSRIRAEYLEMPGLRLTVPQAERLCGGDEPTCAAVLDMLVEQRFLRRRPDGSYTRLTGGPQVQSASTAADAFLRAAERARRH
jgi:hypothetical protein